MLFARKMDTLTDKIDSMNDRQKDRHQATIDCLRGIKADMASHKGLLESIKATQPIPRG